MSKKKPSSQQAPSEIPRIIIEGLISQDNGGAGVSISADSPPISMKGVLTSRKAGDGFVVRDPESALSRLGVPPEAPRELVAELLQAVAANGALPETARAEVVSGSRLGGWLVKRGIDGSTLTANLLAIWNSPQLQQLLSLF